MNLNQKIKIIFVFFSVFVSCSKNESNDFEIKNKQIFIALDSFIVESNYKAINQSKNIVINFYKYSNDTLLYFERASPYIIEEYKGRIRYKDFNVFLFSNINDYRNFETFEIHKENMKFAKTRNVDQPFKKGYKFKNGVLKEY
jgi:hypothetical protein